MNDYKRNPKSTTITNLFAIACIIIVCYIGVVSSKQTTWINLYESTLSNQSGSNQAKSGTPNIIQKGWQTKQDATRMNPIPTRNSSVQNRTGWKPMGSLQTVSAVKTANVNTHQNTWVIVLVKGFPKDSMATKIATYEYKISWGDMDFMATMKAENWWYNIYQQSNVINKYGKREESYGLCQMMRRYHQEVNTKIFRESWEYQVEICYKKYKGGTKFYGFNVRHQYKDDFILVTN